MASRSSPQLAREEEAAAQSAINSVFCWSQQGKLNLNANKSEVCPFSTWSNSSTWEPAIFIGSQQIWVNNTPKKLKIKEINCSLNIEPLYPPSNSAYIRRLVLFHSKD